MPRDGERQLIEVQRLGQLTPPMVNLCEPANRGEVLGGVVKDLAKLDLGSVEIVHLDQRTAKRHPGGEITWMDCEAGVTGVYGLVVAARTPVFLGELSECDRRRVGLDPASKRLNARVVGHSGCLRRSRAEPFYGVTVMLRVMVAVLPLLSVTVRVTLYVNVVL